MKIYIPLWGKGVESWRPVEAEHVGGNKYRILETQPADEEWPFTTGEIVTCKRHCFPDDLQGLVVTLDSE